MHNGESVIDSREVIALIEELRDIPVTRRTDDEHDELINLVRLAHDGERASDEWTHGVALVRDSYFVDYARQYAEEIGALSGSESWPHNCIDWEYAASELQSNYTSIDFDGVIYWMRVG